MKSRDELRSDVVKLIAGTMPNPPAEFDPASSLADAGLSSLALVEVMFVLEESYGISIPYNANAPAAGQDFGSVGGMLDTVVGLIAEQQQHQPSAVAG